jgi:hypothetical protein
MRYMLRRLVRSESPKAIGLALLGANSENLSDPAPKPEKRFRTTYSLRMTVADILTTLKRNQRSSVWQAPVVPIAGPPRPSTLAR